MPTLSVEGRYHALPSWIMAAAFGIAETTDSHSAWDSEHGQCRSLAGSHTELRRSRIDLGGLSPMFAIRQIANIAHQPERNGAFQQGHHEHKQPRNPLISGADLGV